jgi:predicted enzyme related to lactoylglutathione lyase
MDVGLRFIWLEVADLDHSVRFYRDLLGMHVEAAIPQEGRRTACVDGGELELVLVESGPATTPRGAGVRIYLSAHDIEHHRAALQSRGVAAPEPREEAWGGRVVPVPDPDGYLLCFSQARRHMMHDEP